MTDIQPPTAEQVAATRQAAGITQAKSANLVHVAIGTWKQYEAGDRTPHVAVWELYLLKSGQHPTLAITEKSPVT
jgi:DNA-binding XRE family transcriptional regulator